MENTQVATKPKTKEEPKIISRKAILRLLNDNNNSRRYDESIRPMLGEFSSVASVYLKDSEGNSTAEVARGLNKIQERIFLPRDYVTYDVENNEFAKGCRNFWIDYEVNILKGTTRRLNASYYIAKDKEGNEYEHPVNLKDYMDYTFAMQNPTVAKTTTEAESSNYQYSLLIEEDLMKDSLSKIKLTQKANALFDEVVSKMRSDVGYRPVAERIVDLLQAYTGEIDKTSDDAIEVFLYEVKEKRPQTFISVMEDKEAETKHLIYKLVEHKILTLNDNIYLYGNKIIGSDINQAIAYIHNSNNEDVPVLKSQLANAIQQKIK